MCFVYRKFAATRTAAEDPLNAAKVYENIIEAINEADREVQEASKAADNATKQV